MFSKDKILFLDKEIKSKDELFRILAKTAVKTGIATDEDKVFEAYQEREKLGTTGFTDGFGIPHCKTDAITEPSVIFVKSKVPIQWDSLDGKPLENMFSLLVPETGGGEHLKMLATISRKLMVDDFRTAVKNAKTDTDVLKLLKQI